MSNLGPVVGRTDQRRRLVALLDHHRLLSARHAAAPRANYEILTLSLLPLPRQSKTGGSPAGQVTPDVGTAERAVVDWVHEGLHRLRTVHRRRRLRSRLPRRLSDPRRRPRRGDRPAPAPHAVGRASTGRKKPARKRRSSSKTTDGLVATLASPASAPRHRNVTARCRCWRRLRQEAWRLADVARR